MLRNTMRLSWGQSGISASTLPPVVYNAQFFFCSDSSTFKGINFHEKCVKYFTFVNLCSRYDKIGPLSS